MADGQALEIIEWHRRSSDQRSARLGWFWHGERSGRMRWKGPRPVGRWTPDRRSANQSAKRTESRGKGLYADSRSEESSWRCFPYLEIDWGDLIFLALSMWLWNYFDTFIVFAIIGIAGMLHMLSF